MSDKYDEYFDSKEANEDSKSDSRVALILIAVFVVGYGFLGFRSVTTQIKISQHLKQPYNQSQPK